MKRFLTFVLAVILVMSLGVTALGAEYTGEVDPINVLLVNADTGEILYSKNESAQAYTAGLVKLMTAYVTVKSIEDLDTVVTIPPYTFSNLDVYSDITLYPSLSEGEQITVRDLLAGMLVASGNDCALALATYVGGSVSGFVDLMNSYADDLGMTNTNYTNPTGTHYGSQFSSAADIAKLVREILKYPELMDIFGVVSYTIPATNMAEERTVYNTNRLICAYSEEENYIYEDATGMIAGYTSHAASCLAATAEKYGTNLICIILGDISASRTTRWTLAADLFEFGFEQYIPLPASDVLADIPLTYTDADGTEYTVEADFTDITVKYNTTAEGITAAITSEDGTSGTATYTDAGGNIVAEVPVTLTSTIAEEPEEPDEPVVSDEPVVDEPEEVPEEEPEEEKKERKKNPVLAIILSVIILAAAVFGANFLVKKKSTGRHKSESDSFKVKFRQNFMTYLLFAVIAVILIVIICAILV